MQKMSQYSFFSNTIFIKVRICSSYKTLQQKHLRWKHAAVLLSGDNHKPSFGMFLLHMHTLRLGSVFGTYFLFSSQALFSQRPLSWRPLRSRPFQSRIYYHAGTCFFIGGLHHAAAQISGDNVYKHLKYEGGSSPVPAIPRWGCHPGCSVFTAGCRWSSPPPRW